MAGTPSKNQVLELSDPDAPLTTIERTGLAIQASLHEIIDRRGLPHVFTGVPAMFGVMFAEQLPADYRGWAATDQNLPVSKSRT